MIIRWDECSGPPDEVAGRLVDDLGEYAGRRRRFRVGLTLDPERRAAARADGGWRELVVVYTTSSVACAAKVELLLIAHGWESALEPGAFDLVRGSGLPPGWTGYHLYVLLA